MLALRAPAKPQLTRERETEHLGGDWEGMELVAWVGQLQPHSGPQKCWGAEGAPWPGFGSESPLGSRPEPFSTPQTTELALETSQESIRILGNPGHHLQHLRVPWTLARVPLNRTRTSQYPQDDLFSRWLEQRLAKGQIVLAGF